MTRKQSDLTELEVARESLHKCQEFYDADRTVTNFISLQVAKLGLEVAEGRISPADFRARVDDLTQNYEIAAQKEKLADQDEQRRLKF